MVIEIGPELAKALVSLGCLVFVSVALAAFLRFMRDV
jgi:hypothetical protein